MQLTPGAQAQWNNAFNVDWGGFDANGVANPGYSARSTDLMLGLRKMCIRDRPRAVSSWRSPRR